MNPAAWDDQALQTAATLALGKREGTVVVLDPQNGRIRALVNPRLAIGQAFPPGSAIKPFTALTALRAHVFERGTLRQCSGGFAQGDYETLCSHPKSQSPFNLPQALAYSCNDYFGHLGQRLGASTVNSMLRSFGFGQRTEVNLAGEVDGQLLQGEWRVQEALGDSESLLTTPLQLLLAYSALVNGGQLYRPQQSPPDGFIAQPRRHLTMVSGLRAVLLEGMRGAVRYGTAETAQLDQLPFYVFGKTGTSAASNGFQTQGWFVGFVAPSRNAGLPAPADVGLGVIVLLKRAHGSQGAEVLRDLLNNVAKLTSARARQTRTEAMTAFAPLPQSPVKPHLPARVTVRLVTEKRTFELPFDAYIAGVVAAEASIENQPEALKAQSVVSRTYALQNLGRHKAEGFDFCSTTHCQRFWALSSAKTRDVVKRAVQQTAGEILQDAQGQPAETYFHAACGGQTANLETLWGKRAPVHLRGVTDDFCATRPNRHWKTRLSAAQLAQALRRDARTNVGAMLQRIEVLQHDASGRAQRVALSGSGYKEVGGWDFKIIVGRALGWQWLKSSWFDVQRRGDQFVFTGKGFGHGLGLCQEGAHVMAAHGKHYHQILEFYFPGTFSNRNAQVTMPKVEQVELAGYVQRPSQAVLASEHFRARFSTLLPRHDIEAVLQVLEHSRLTLRQQLAQASLQWIETAPVELVIHATTAEFITATGKPGWVAAVTRDRRIELQPPVLLRRRGVFTSTLRHELAHVVIEALSHQQAPRWLAEGLAITFAGEGRLLNREVIKNKLSTTELEQRLSQPTDSLATRQLYAQAYQAVQKMISTKGVAAVWQSVARHKPSI